MTSTKVQAVKNDEFAIISQFDAGKKWTGVSVNGATHKAVRGGTPAFPYETVNIGKEKARLFRFNVRGQEVELLTRYAKLNPEDSQAKTLCYVRNEDAPLFQQDDAVVADASDLDTIDL